MRMLQFLCDHCAESPDGDASRELKHIWTALSIAAVTGQLEACERLVFMLDKCDSFPRDALASLKQALAAVTDSGFGWFCTSLLEQSICSDRDRADSLDSLLRDAVDADQLGTVKLLLNSGSNARSLDASLVIKAAHARGQIAIMDLLVSRGARLPSGINPGGHGLIAPALQHR